MEVNGYPSYLIYDDGRVQNKKTGRILKPSLNAYNYYRIGLNKNNKSQSFLIHRLVAIHYIPNPNNYTEVDHIDIDKKNNHVSNLRWCSRFNNCNNTTVYKNNKLGIKNICKHGNEYIFRKRYNGKYHTKTFKTLEEAIQYKDVFYSNLDDVFCKK